MEILPSNEPPQLLTNVEVLSLLQQNPPKDDSLPALTLGYLKKSTPKSICATLTMVKLKGSKKLVPDPDQDPNPDDKGVRDLMEKLSRYGLEHGEVLQIVNLMPDNVPLLNVIIPEAEER